MFSLGDAECEPGAIWTSSPNECLGIASQLPSKEEALTVRSKATAFGPGESREGLNCKPATDDSSSCWGTWGTQHNLVTMWQFLVCFSLINRLKNWQLTLGPDSFWQSIVSVYALSSKGTIVFNLLCIQQLTTICETQSYNLIMPANVAMCLKPKWWMTFAYPKYFPVYIWRIMGITSVFFCFFNCQNPLIIYFGKLPIFVLKVIFSLCPIACSFLSLCSSVTLLPQVTVAYP